MKKINTLFALGIIIAVFPHLGFPGTIKTVVVSVCGIFTACISGIMIIQHRARRSLNRVDNREVFVDNENEFFKKDLHKDGEEDSE